MRKNIAAGLVLAVAAIVLFVASAAFDLDIEPVVLLGLGVGATLALVPDGTATTRVVGTAVGVLVSLAAFVARAGVLPDTDNGRSVAVVVVILVCVAVYAVSLGHLPLWSSLLGAGAFAGAYEITYTAAPPQVLSTSLTTATSVLLAIAAGFVSVAFFGGGPAEDDRDAVTDARHLDLMGADQ